MKHHSFPLIDRTGQRVIVQRTREQGTIVGRGSCAYYIEINGRTETRSAYELGYLDEPEPEQKPARSMQQRYEQLSLL